MITLNEYVRLCRGNKYAAAKSKKDTESFIMFCIKTQLKNVKFKKPIFLSFYWYAKNKKMDLDNIAFAKKFVLDALVKSGAIENDGWANVVGFEDKFFVDKNNPRVEVEITEI
jgi:Holliday junction resolvase RusA-like endonuclease